MFERQTILEIFHTCVLLVDWNKESASDNRIDLDAGEFLTDDDDEDWL